MIKKRNKPFMDTIIGKKLFREEDQKSIYNNYYEMVIAAVFCFLLFTIIIDFIYLESRISASMILNLSILPFLTAGLLLRKRLSPWSKELILIGICLMLITSTLLSPVKIGLRENCPAIYWINRIFFLTVFMIISIGSIKKMYHVVTSTRQTNPVTDMGNTRWISLMVNKSITKGLETGSLLLVSVKNFRIINAIFGRQYGDLLIKMMADHFKKVSGDKLKAAHLSGIEFCLWTENMEEAFIYNVLEFMKREMMKKVQETSANTNLYINTAGSVYPRDGRTFNELFCKANMALEKTLLSSDLAHVFYEPEIEHSLKINHHYAYEIKRAVELEKFHVAYQAKYDMNGNRVTGVEALARWDSGKSGTVPPSIFIPIIHKSYLTIPFTKLIIKTVLREIDLIEDKYGKDIQVSINIPPTFFNYYEIHSFVERILNETGADPNRLTFEITEDMLIERTGDFNIKLEGLRKMGIKISLDDFGTGFSSLSCLQDMPIDELKIDKSFIDRIDRSENCFTLVKAICDIAKANSYQVVAEGVENTAQLEKLRQTSCDLIQGYIYSKPERIAKPAEIHS